MDANALQRAMKEMAKGLGENSIQAFNQWVERSTQEAVEKMVSEGFSVTDKALPSPPSPLIHSDTSG